VTSSHKGAQGRDFSPLSAAKPACTHFRKTRNFWMIGSLMMCVSVVVLLVGMLAGIAMGILQNFTLAPAHAHLNLIGGVLLFLFGLYYRLIPAAGATLLAKVQGWLHIILFPAGVALVLLKGPSFEAAPITGALAMVCSMTLFAIIVFRTSRA
jgi:hypothetical protein